jgi:hypothetical protein
LFKKGFKEVSVAAGLIFSSAKALAYKYKCSALLFFMVLAEIHLPSFVVSLTCTASFYSSFYFII